MNESSILVMPVKKMKGTLRRVIKWPLKYIPILLEKAWFDSPKTSGFAVWYNNNISDRGGVSFEPITARNRTSDPIAWERSSKVKFSGVFVLSRGKILMCRPKDVHQRHLSSRKAIACTKNYRPLKYPGAQSPFVSVSFLHRNLSYWLVKDGHIDIPGNVALLGNSVYDNANYYHFWADVIADIWYIRQHVPEADLPAYYLVPLSNMAWQWDVLSLCGVNKSQVIPYAAYDVFSLGKLIIPVRDKGSVNLPSWLCRAMHAMSEWSPRAKRGERLLFISRADADRRRVVNEEVVRECLQDKGFEVHTLNGLSIAEQQELFASAAIICAPHGAALTNLVWCGPGTTIIEFLSERHLNPCFRELATQNHLHYYAYVCNQAEEASSGITGDIVVSETQIDSLIDLVSGNVSEYDAKLLE